MRSEEGLAYYSVALSVDEPPVNLWIIRVGLRELIDCEAHCGRTVIMTGRAGTTSTLGWLTAASCLLGVIMLESSGGIPLAPTVTAAAIETKRAEPDSSEKLIIGLPSSALLDDIIDRPLFSALRRPFEPMIEEQPSVVREAPPNELAAQLVGTMVAGETRLALLKDGDGNFLKLRPGQEVEGWLVDRIDHENVRLQKNEKVEWLKIRTNIEKAASPGPKTPRTLADRNLSNQESRRSVPATNEANGQAQ